MNTPEIQSPEFGDFPMSYLSDDEVPETIVELLTLCFSDIGADLARSANLFNDWVQNEPDHPSKSPISPKGFDEASVGHFEGSLRGAPLPMAVGTYPLWVLQRGLDWLHAQEDSSQKAARTFIEQCGGREVVNLRLRRPLTRVGSRMALE